MLLPTVIQEIDLHRTISISTQAWPIRRIASELGKVSRLDIEIRAPLDRNVAILHVTGMPVRTVLDRLASALSCSWRVEDQKIVFDRDGRQTRRLEAEREAATVAALKESLTKIPTSPLTETKVHSLVAEASSFETRYASYGSDANLRASLDSLNSRMPIGRSIGLALRQLNLVDLARMRRGQRTVFASQANRAQKELKGAQRILTSFNQERSLVRQAIGDAAAKASAFNPYDPRYLQYVLPQTASKVLLAIHRRPRGISAEIVFADAQGTIISRQFKFLIDEPILTAPKLARAVIHRSPDHMKLTELYRAPWLVSHVERKKWGEMLGKPDRMDWQEWLSGSTLKDYGQEIGKNLVAVLSDAGLWRPTPTANRPELASEELASLAVQNWYLADHSESDCLVFGPSTPLDSEARYLDRGLIQAMLSKLQGEGRLQLRDVAIYASLAKSEQAGLGIEQRLVSALSPHGPLSPDRDMTDMMLFPVERFLGELNADQWNAMFTVSEVTERARRAMHDWLFNGVIRLQFVEDAFSLARPLGVLQKTEITEALPDGVTNDIQLSFRSSAVPLIYVRDGETLLSPEDAAFLIDADHPTESEVDSVSGTVFELQVRLPKGLIVPVRIYEAPIPSERKWKKVGELPQTVLEVLRRELKRQSESTPPMQLGGGRPPPR